MGVKRALTCKKASTLFGSKNFTSITATIDGIIDTTYMAQTADNTYVIKHYESTTPCMQESERKLLKILQHHNLHVPEYLETSGDGVWHLFSAINGESIVNPTLREIGLIATFLGKFHKLTVDKKSSQIVFTSKKSKVLLQHLRKKNVALYYSFKDITCADIYVNDGIIHGDLFKDNAKYDGENLGVFDFIESGEGSFAFDAGVTALNWCIRNSQSDRGRVRLFLKSYNQYTCKKLTLKTLEIQMKYAGQYYALSQVIHQQKSFKEQLKLLQGLRRIT